MSRIRSSRRRIYIPIIEPGTSGAGKSLLMEAYAQHKSFSWLSRHEEKENRQIDVKSYDKDWDHVAAPLRKAGIYQSGCVAASAVRKIGIERPIAAFYQQLSRFAWIEHQRLHLAGARSPTEGRSAELGLALALLICAAGSSHQVIATGALGGQPHWTDEDDVEVQPIGSLLEKLRLVLSLAQHRMLPGQQRWSEMFFITPKTFEGEGTVQQIDELPEVAALRKHGIHVMPVQSLREAAKILGTRQARYLQADKLIAASLIGLISMICVYTVWSMILNAKIEIAFAPTHDEEIAAEPFQACISKDGESYKPKPLLKSNLAATIPAGETLAWRVRVGASADQRGGLFGWFNFDHYYLAQFIVSEYSSVRVAVPEFADGKAIKAGDIFEWGWQLTQHQENNALVLLARPLYPFSSAELKMQLTERFPPAGKDNDRLDVLAMVDYITSLAPGAMKFFFQTVEMEDRCVLP